MEADQAMTVVDTLNSLDLAYATNAQELATALQRVSSVAQTAGVSFQDLSSVLTVVSSNTRLSAETIGNGLKSLFSRLQNIKVGRYLSDEGMKCFAFKGLYRLKSRSGQDQGKTNYFIERKGYLKYNVI